MAQLNRDSLDAANEKMVSPLPELIQKAMVAKSDSTIWLTADMRKDHRLYGYEKADRNSRRLLLFSIFTNDVEGNPFQLPFGAWYQTAGLGEKKLKYAGAYERFIKAGLWNNNGKQLVVEMYFERKWFEFE